jgi:hypothetical protein
MRYMSDCLELTARITKGSLRGHLSNIILDGHSIVAAKSGIKISVIHLES